MGYDSIISPRALREIYLMPFMLAMKHAEPWAIMTAYGYISSLPKSLILSSSYNRVNGPHVSENPFFLKKILRQEWNFNGVVSSLFPHFEGPYCKSPEYRYIGNERLVWNVRRRCRPQRRSGPGDARNRQMAHARLCQPCHHSPKDNNKGHPCSRSESLGTSSKMCQRRARSSFLPRRFLSSTIIMPTLKGPRWRWPRANGGERGGQSAHAQSRR